MGSIVGKWRVHYLINRKLATTVLVSGASGFLGHELITQLLGDNCYKVIALTSKKRELAKEFEGKSNLEVLHVDNWFNDINNYGPIDTFVNCAFPRSSDPEQLAKGLVFTENIIKKALELKVKNIINISSQSVYSQKSKSLTTETANVVPESLYGMAKYASERLVASICENSAKNVYFSNIRLASLTGLEFELRMTNRFVKNAIVRKPIAVNGGGQSISYLEVRDAATALIAMLNTNPDLWKKIYNLGNYESYTVMELARTVQDTAVKHSINNVELEVNKGQQNFNNLINSELFYKDFGWRPSYTLQAIIEELFIYYKKRV